jgi:hypothetical protein
MRHRSGSGWFCRLWLAVFTHLGDSPLFVSPIELATSEHVVDTGPNGSGRFKDPQATGSSVMGASPGLA